MGTVHRPLAGSEKGESVMYAIVYGSKTGNTKALAEAAHAVLPEKDCVYLGPPDPKGATADDILAGFWTDKGNCDKDMKAFLKGLEGKRIFLFGTAGFGGSEEYFNRILESVRKNIPKSNTIVGTFMCQGKMPATVRQRYESMLSVQPNKMKSMIKNFDRALSHPDEQDIQNMKESVTAAFN